MAVLTVAHQLRTQGTFLMFIDSKRGGAEGASDRVKALLTLIHHERTFLAVPAPCQSIAIGTSYAFISVLAEGTVRDGFLAEQADIVLNL